MPPRPIVMYPDPRLDQRAAEVTAFDDTLRALATDLLDTMRAAPGVGITGPHVGDLRRVVVVELGPGQPVETFVNPVLVATSGPPSVNAEGSVSMPGASAEIERPSLARVAYVDLFGRPHEIEATGFRAIVLQHEIDQLDGIFWLKRLSRLKRERVIKAWTKGKRA
jgi:peptide deformylase